MTDLTADLDAYLDAELDTVADEAQRTREPFIVDNLDKAEWAMRKWAQATARIADVEELAARRRAMLDEWAAARTDRDRATLEFMEMLLTGYLESVRAKEEADGVAEDRRTKSIALPSGAFRSSAGRPSIVVDDEAALVEWLEMEHPDLVRRSPIKGGLADVTSVHASPVDGDLLRLVTPDGQVVPGVHVEVGARTYRCHPPK